MSSRHNRRKKKQKASHPTSSPVISDERCQEHPDNKEEHDMKHTSQDERKISLGPATVLISILALLVTFAQAYFARQTMRMEQRAWINYSFGQSSMVVGQP